MNIAIFTKHNDSSPKILAQSLQLQLKSLNVDSFIYFDLDVLNRLVSYKNSKLNFHFWLRRKLIHWVSDKKKIKKLKEYDAIVISECIPNAYYKSYYGIEKLKALIKKPLFVFEVYALENAPTQLSALKTSHNTLANRFDGHLAVSAVTEIRNKFISNAFYLGLQANTWGLNPLPKKELIALVDFVQPGFEEYRVTQIRQLTKAGIKFITLEQRYSIEEIRNIYKQASIYFLQSYEAFGLPIMECLCTGAQVFTPYSSWAMSWRLDDEPKVHGDGILPNCFTVYKDEENLLKELLLFKEAFNFAETPKKVFDIFIENYPTFYKGNKDELLKFVDYIKMCKK
jgi:hypothetical protein